MRRVRLGLRLPRTRTVLERPMRRMRLRLGLQRGPLFERSMWRLRVRFRLSRQRQMLERKVRGLRFGLRLQRREVLAREVRSVRLRFRLPWRTLLRGSLLQRDQLKRSATSEGGTERRSDGATIWALCRSVDVRAELSPVSRARRRSRRRRGNGRSGDRRCLWSRRTCVLRGVVLGRRRCSFFRRGRHRGRGGRSIRRRGGELDDFRFGRRRSAARGRVDRR